VNVSGVEGRSSLRRSIAAPGPAGCSTPSGVAGKASNASWCASGSYRGLHSGCINWLNCFTGWPSHGRRDRESLRNGTAVLHSPTGPVSMQAASFG
jgi:hypothetical protein